MPAARSCSWPSAAISAVMATTAVCSVPVSRGPDVPRDVAAIQARTLAIDQDQVETAGLKSLQRMRKGNHRGDVSQIVDRPQGGHLVDGVVSHDQDAAGHSLPVDWRLQSIGAIEPTALLDRLLHPFQAQARRTHLVRLPRHKGAGDRDEPAAEDFPRHRRIGPVRYPRRTEDHRQNRNGARPHPLQPPLQFAAHVGYQTDRLNRQNL